MVVDTIKDKIIGLNKEKSKVKRSYYLKHLGYGLSIPFFLVIGALSIVASPLAAVSWMTIGAGLANSYRKHLNTRKSQLDGIDKEIQNLKGIKRVNVSAAKKTERANIISQLKGEVANHKTAIESSKKARKISNGLFVGSTLAGLLLPIPFAITAPLVLAYKAKKDSDVIKHSNKIELINKRVDYIETEQKIAEQALALRNARAAQNQRNSTQQPTQPQQTQRRQAANTSPTKSRDEKLIDEYIESISKKPEELQINKKLIKK